MSEKIKKIEHSFFCAWKGLVYATINERNFQIELFCAYFVFALAIWLDVERWEAVALLLSVGMVLILEIINTAIERIVNILKPGMHPWAKVVKDLTAATVLLACLMAGLVGIFVFWPYLFKMKIF